MKYLLAAEADRIQDLIFRSSRLREVVGGSQLLSRLFADVPDALAAQLDPEVDIVTKGGGGLRVVFDCRDDAIRFGGALAETYNRATGGTLSVAAPVELSDNPSREEWILANEEVGENLRRVKLGGVPLMTTQLPHVAFCESCGVGLAEAHERWVEEPGEEPHYLCPSCRHKAAERVTESLGQFLTPFYRDISPSVKPGDWPTTADTVGELDPRGYVAYIVADGDSMGSVFRKCDREQSRELSDKMNRVSRQALAEAMKRFMHHQTTDPPGFIPALPLILGGDDLFALVPAPWALDIARHLCRTFQREMTQCAQDLGIDRQITMTAAVVICKANYPYYLAHDIGKERLSAAKRAVKALAADTETRLSAVDLEIVIGSQIETEARSGKYRPTLRPYWVRDTDGAQPPAGWGLTLDLLFDWRLGLAQIPSRRISQLRALYDRVDSASPEAWQKEQDQLLERIKRDVGQDALHPVHRAMEELGGVELANWYDIRRTNVKEEERWQGHGLPDLLRAWDWTFQLDLTPAEYEGGGR